MGLFNRRPRLPADERPALERGERVLCWARVAGSPGAAAPGDGVVVVTNRGVWLPGEAHRIGWHEVHKAVWSGRELAITPAEVVAERDGYVVVADRPVRSCPLTDPGDVPHQVRARVTGSVAHTSHHRLAAGGGVRVVARRVSGVDGLTWTVRYDPGTVPGDGVVPADGVVPGGDGLEAVTEETDRLVAAAQVSAAPAD